MSHTTRRLAGFLFGSGPQGVSGAGKQDRPSWRLQEGFQSSRPIACNRQSPQTYGLRRLPQQAMLRMNNAQTLQAQATLGHGGHWMQGTPLNQRRQAAIEQARTIVAHGDLPLKQALWSLSASGQRGATVDTQALPGTAGRPHIPSAGHPMRQCRPIASNTPRKLCIVQVEPSALMGATLCWRTRLDRNDFEIGLRISQ